MKEMFLYFQGRNDESKTRLARVLLIYLYVCIVGPFLVFASFGTASAPKGFLACVVMETQHA